MTAAAFIRNILGIVLFPLSLWNLSMNQKNKMTPPGKIVKTEKSSVHIIKSGEGPVTVILEAGLGSLSIDWCQIQPEISKRAKVLSYDRGSYGWSQSTKKYRTALDHVEELKEILVKVDLAPPYLLVGHSYGGLIMRLFASMHPEQVKGLILVDSVHENQYMPGNQNKGFKHKVTFGYVISLTGFPRLLKQKVGRKFLTGEYQRYLNYTGYTLGAYQTIYQEYKDSPISAQQLKDSAAIHKDIPVVVISSNNSTKQWKEQQLLLAKLTSKTEHIQTDKGHSIHLEDPTVVTDTIFKLLEREATSHV